MPVFNAGSIEATLDVDPSPFDRALNEARAKGKSFERERWRAKLDVDSAAANRALTAINTKLTRFRGTHNARLTVSNYGQTNTQILRTTGLLDNLERTYRPKIELDGVPESVAEAAVLNRSLDALTQEREAEVGIKVDQGGLRQIDRASGRLALYAKALAVVGPGLIPVGALAAPALTGIVDLLGGVVLGAGATVLAFQGIGEASTALTEYGLDPTAENLAKVKEALAGLAPEARQFVLELQTIKPLFDQLQGDTAGAFFGGFEGGLQNVVGLLPEFREILVNTAGEAGTLGEEITASLDSDRWAGYLAFLAEDAPEALRNIVEIAGPAAKGVAELMMAFEPLNDDFAGYLAGKSQDFEGWASGLKTDPQFMEFMEYVRDNGPRVAEAAGAIGNALLQVVQAASPLGGPTLMAIEAVADAVALIADSPLGTPFLAAVSAVTLLNTGLKASVALQGALGLAAGRTAATSAVAAGGAAVATGAGSAAAAAAGGAAASKYTPSTKTVGTLAAVAVAPAAIEYLQDLSGGYDGVASSVDEVAAALQRGSLPDEFGNIGENLTLLNDRSDGFAAFSDGLDETFGMVTETMEEAKAEAAALDGALVQIANTKGPEAAQKAFTKFGEELGFSAAEMGELKAQLPGFESAVSGLPGLFDFAPGGGFLNGVVKALEKGTDSAYDFKAAMQSASAFLEGRASARDFEAAIDAATASLKQNGKTLDINTEKGRANEAALDNIAASAGVVAEGLKGVARTEALQRARTQLIRIAQAMGMGAKEARELADDAGLADQSLSLLGRRTAKPIVDLVKNAFDFKTKDANNKLTATDKRVARPGADLATGAFDGKSRGVMDQLNVTDRFTANPTVNLNDMASAKARSIQASINAITGKSVDIVINTFRNVFGGKANEDGGFYNGPVRAFEDGGYGSNGRYYSRTPQIVQGGANIVWGEKATGWEAYISGKPSERDRNLEVLDMAAQRLGVGAANPSATLTPAGWDGATSPRPRGRGSNDADRIVAAIRSRPPVVVVARSDDQAAELIERVDFAMRRR